MHPLSRSVTIDHLNSRGIGVGIGVGLGVALQPGQPGVALQPGQPGVALQPGQPGIFVPYSLAGEIVRAEIVGDWAKIVAIETLSPQRVDPICPLFGVCGGCALQHWRFSDYCDWKVNLLKNALHRVGLFCAESSLIDAQGEGRRRVALHACFLGGGRQQIGGKSEVEIGFMRARSHDIIEIEHCPILAPALAPAPKISENLALVLQKSQKSQMGQKGQMRFDIWLTQSAQGLDVDIRGCGEVENQVQQRLVAQALKLDLARLSMHGRTLVSTRHPWQIFGTSQVLPPPGSFLQATVMGEKILTHLVEEGVGAARTIADLFSGVGTFGLPLAQRGDVRAFEVDADAVKAANQARRAAQVFPFRSEQRDLMQNPLRVEELNDFEAIVFDPPRAGAEQQAQQIAQSNVARVVGVACDVGNFARDAKILVDGGFELERVFAVDQFRYSAHLEIVGYFRKARRKRKRSILG